MLLGICQSNESNMWLFFSQHHQMFQETSHLSWIKKFLLWLQQPCGRPPPGFIPFPPPSTWFIANSINMLKTFEMILCSSSSYFLFSSSILFTILPSFLRPLAVFSNVVIFLFLPRLASLQTTLWGFYPTKCTCAQNILWFFPVLIHHDWESWKWPTPLRRVGRGR